jgi:hypothetical protein
MRRRILLCAAAALFAVQGAESVHAQTLIYSFEDPLAAGPDGFFGLGAVATQEPTIGVTHLRNSLKYLAGPGGFVGVRTETVPAALNDPPGVKYVLFDLTITEPYAGAFADIGVTIFGHALNDPGGASFGHQVQFADTVSFATLPVGTYADMRIDLDVAQSYRAGESFNDIFGPGPTDLTVASAFQFYISKNAGVQTTVYIDNVRLAVPEPATLAMACLGAIAVGLSRRKN